jgi:16S rRNA (cytidine1402-2'-O)-methyltransferase
MPANVINPEHPGSLYIVATPIGNIQDITLRALEVLKSVDAVICEEARIGSTLLKRLGISPKELLILNEHNEKEKAPELITRFWSGQNLAGKEIIQLAVQSGVRVIPIPGASSLSTFLSILDEKVDRFIFAGFLSREPNQRARELSQLKTYRMPIILMDTPYRLKVFLDSVIAVFGKGQRATLGCNLTLPNESIFRGKLETIQKAVGDRKAEFMLILHS